VRPRRHSALLCGPSTSPLERMAYLVALVAAFAVGSAADSPKPPAVPPQADAALEIHSYGETAQNLRELFLPLLARLDFSEVRRYSFESQQRVESGFKRADGDRVFILGSSNCLVIGYFSTRHPAVPPLLGPADRANHFIAEVKDFIGTLPTTRPRAHDTLWSWKSWCTAFPRG